MFFTPEFYIDAVQDTKRMLTNQIIKDETLNEAAINYIDAQTKFAKMMVQNSITLSKYFVDTISKCATKK